MNGLKLKAKCVEQGINVESLADSIGIDKSTFYRKIKGETFTVKETRRISQLLNLSEKDVISIFFEKVVT